MSKLEVINKIRNKLVGNIKNKLWFKNYQYKSPYTKDDKKLLFLSFSAVYCAITIPFGELYFFQKIEPQLGSLTPAFISLIVIFGLSALTSFSLFKFMNKKNKKEISCFIKDSEDRLNKLMINFMNENEVSNNLKQLASFIKDQPLEKKDLDLFNKMLVENFSEKELNHVFYNEKLNDMIKEKGCIDYDYVLYALNLLEDKKESIEGIKDFLFKEKSLENKKTIKNKIEKEIEVSILNN